MADTEILLRANRGIDADPAGRADHKISVGKNLYDAITAEAATDMEHQVDPTGARIRQVFHPAVLERDTAGADLKIPIGDEAQLLTLATLHDLDEGARI